MNSQTHDSPRCARGIMALLSGNSSDLAVLNFAARLARHSAAEIRLARMLPPEKSYKYAREAMIWPGTAADPHGYGMPEPWTSPGLVPDRAWQGRPRPWIVEETPSSEAATAARATMHQLVAASGITDLPIQYEILAGEEAGTLLRRARDLGIHLLVTGPAGKKDRRRIWARRTSQLFAAPDMLVIQVPDEMHRSSETTARVPGVLLADDLTTGSEPALSAATRLVDALSSPLRVLHLHVAPHPMATLTVSPDYSLELWPAVSMRTRLLNDHHEGMLHQLKARSESLRAKVISNGGSYATELWHGNVAEEIARAAEVHGADLTIMGRHKTLHLHPMGVGQMPGRAVRHIGSPVLITGT